MKIMTRGTITIAAITPADVPPPGIVMCCSAIARCSKWGSLVYQRGEERWGREWKRGGGER